MGQLVTDSRFLTTSPYISQIRSTGLEGSSPFFEKKPWTVHGQDSSVGQDARGARTPEYWLLAGPSLITPHSKGAPEWLSNPLVGQPSNSWVLMGFTSVFSFVSLLLVAVRSPLGRTNRHLTRPLRERPGTACA
jgi:hypothetical protein